jgi:hypothetical protein
MSVFFTIVVMVLQGCATPVRLPAVPAAFEDQAQVPGLAYVRYRMGFEKDLLQELPSQ